jgi:hypothetical protein
VLARVKDTGLRPAPLRGRLRRSLTRAARAGRCDPVGTGSVNVEVRPPPPARVEQGAWLREEINERHELLVKIIVMTL